MTAVDVRLRRLEQKARNAESPSVRAFWRDELVPCQKHPRCDIEVETGAHHQRVVHLSFDGPPS